MKRAIAKTAIPVLAGILCVLFLLILVDFAIYGNFGFLKDTAMYTHILPVAIVGGLVAQRTVVLPLWSRFAERGSVLGLTLIPHAALGCLLGGTAFAYLFWERSFGVKELLRVFLTGLVACITYAVFNIIALKRLERPMAT